MGMAGPDIVLFVIGALLFGGAVTALVAQGGLAGGGSPTGLFTVTYTTVAHDVKTQPVADYAVPQTVTADVTMMNVSVVHFTVKCADPVPGGTFNIQVQITPPAGIPAPPARSGACGADIKVDVPITGVPPSTTVQGNTADAAKASLEPATNASAAKGAWTIKTQGARSAGPVPGGVPGAGPVTTSGSIVVSADMWEPKLTAVAK